MDIVYTYKKPLYPLLGRDTDQKKWLELSSKTARKLGYRVVLYTDDITIPHGLDIDELNLIECNSKLWDSLKIKVLETRQGLDYFLADYDVEFYTELPLSSDKDIIFDAYEDNIKIWNWAYKNTVEKINSRFTLPNWSSNRIPVINVGILKINNSELKQRYIKEWYKLEQLTKNLNIDPFFLTATVTQYLLTVLVKQGEYTTENYSGTNLGVANKFYYHFNGPQKIKKIRGEVVI
jgi:hypothetical protein